MKRILSVLTLLALLAFGSVAVAQTTTVCDKDNNLDCRPVSTAQFSNTMYGFDRYVTTLLGLPPLLTPMMTVCDKGSTTDCRQVPVGLTNDFFHALDEYVEDATLKVLADSDVVTTTDVSGLINVALAGYSTTSQMNSAISAATSDKVTSAQVGTAISSALSSYSTTSQMNTAITSATSNKVTGAQVDTAISTALASYSTTGQMNTAITSATSNKVTGAQVDTAISTALASYSTTGQMNTAINAATADKTDVPQVEGIVEDALVDYAKTADVQSAGYLTQSQVETIAADAAATAVATALASYQASGPGVAKAWWGKTATGNQKNHNLTAPSLSGQTGTFSFTTPLSSLNYVVLMVTPGTSTDCSVSSQTFTGFFVNCTSGTLLNIRSIAVFDN